jgi:hypothetical protein
MLTYGLLSSRWPVSCAFHGDPGQRFAAHAGGVLDVCTIKNMVRHDRVDIWVSLAPDALAAYRAPQKEISKQVRCGLMNLACTGL